MNIRPLLAFTFIGILWGAGSSQGQAKEWNKEPVAVLQQGAEAEMRRRSLCLQPCT